MATFVVRHIGNSDIDDFRRVRLEALKLHPEAFGASFEEECQQPETFFAERLRLNLVFGGYDLQNRLQGIVGVSINTAPKLHHVAMIWGMYVRAEMRGAGLSRSLLEAALQASCKAKTVKLSVAATNKSARALYCSFGFREWATDTAALYIDGEYHDEILMRLDIN
ncbi:GNAT family N-acetyltransferase [Pectobacterium punjabense]|uniref:GNAT family N-acetyltransferase n=1 Tax=Pectobacterium punjabense TaxID=2108399 RepID=UPI001969990A|nr:GNAT family N-acetyltransferase [Pectobacterium punjabense]MBN3135403.1 GNAT family N-acetyltransferase [Pectobacterium punjabense]MCE5381764.1 GNAT family N-acetyltransferase [Pectobacterium punjabense]